MLKENGFQKPEKNTFETAKFISTSVFQFGFRRRRQVAHLVSHSKAYAQILGPLPQC